jgi:septum formation protein
MEDSNFKFILASASARRKELISHLQIPFEVFTLNTPEESSSQHPSQYCQDISRLKGAAVCEHLRKENRKETSFVVSSDTIVYLDKKIYGKPADVRVARDYLMELSGKTHSVFTAVSMFLYRSGHPLIEKTFFEETLVEFNSIKSEILEKYIATGDSMDKAGAYGIQGASLMFISGVRGDYANVVGFPLSRFILEAQSFFEENLAIEESWLNRF